MDERLNFIFRRRSIRRYLETPVEAEKIDLLLQAGMAAPSAMNNRPWEFIVVTDPQQLEKLRSSTPYCKFKVPLVISVCGNTGLFRNPTGQLFWTLDCSAAAENILLAASALGLGSVWLGVHPSDERKKFVSHLLEIPTTVEVLSIISIGHPSETPEPRSRYEDDWVHYDHW